MKDVQSSAGIAQAYESAIQRICKWRTVFLGWMLGTIHDDQPGLKAHKDRVEAQIMTRVELNALTALLVKKGVCTNEEFMVQLIEECELQQRLYEQKFPGFKATDTGLTIDPQEAAKTTARLGFPP